MSDSTQKTNGKTSTKLYQALSSLTRTELSRLEKYLASPYLNPNEKVTTIIKEIQRVDGLHWKDNLWGKLDSDSYDDKKFRKWMSDALSVLEDFLAFEEFKADQITRDQFLIQALEKRDLEKLQNKIIKSADKALERQAFRNSEYHLQRFSLAKRLYELEKIEQQRVSRRTDFQERLLTILNHLEIFYVAEKLRLFNSLLSWSRLLKFEIDHDHIGGFVEKVENMAISDEAVVETYLSVYHTMKTRDQPEHFLRLLQNIEQHISTFPSKEAKDVFDSALNFCLLQINSGNTSYLNQLFELYELGIKNEILIQDNTISPWSFKNIVTTALRIKKFDWARRFVDRYAEYLPKEYRVSIAGLTNALIAFWTGAWNDVLFHLQKVQFEEASLKLNAELILISTYYELDEDDLLEDAIIKTRKYIKRQKNIGATRAAFTERFLFYLRKISKPLNQNQIKTIRAEIEGEQLASKTWLLEKVDELLS